MSEDIYRTVDLLPCPYCGAGKTEIEVSTLWRGVKPASVISVAIRHLCPKPYGLVHAHIEFRGRTREDAVAAWNHRSYR